MKVLLESLGEYAKDIKTNFAHQIENASEKALNEVQIALTALASGYATQKKCLIDALEAFTNSTLNDVQRTAAKISATMMAMNNVYFRAIHAIKDEHYQKISSGLRMSTITKTGIEKIDFELMCLAVSAVNGCGQCVNSHAEYLIKIGAEKEAAQHALQIASIITGIAQAITIQDL